MDAAQKPRILISHAEIDKTVKRLALEITRDYRGKNPVLVGILKGSFIFLADLVRQLDFPVVIDFVKVSSYGGGQTHSGEFKLLRGLMPDIKGRHVLIVEDIVDTGITLSFLMEYLQKKNPASLKLCALTDKPSRRRKVVKIDYLGMTVPDKFLVGYGLDCDEKYRNLPDICCLEE